MIGKRGEKKLVASVNVPVGYPPEMNSQYDKIISYVETSPQPIVVSGAYHSQVQNHQETGQYICRAGYNFRFWFFDNETAIDFAKTVGGLVEDPPIIPAQRK